MLWNHLLHALAGILFPTLFLWTTDGILAAAAIAVVAQGIDTLRMYSENKAMALRPSMGEHAAAMKIFLYKLAQLFLFKVVWYGLVTLIAASAMRALSA